MTATLLYRGDLRTEATHLASEQIIVTDAPTDNHGKGEAFSPTDLFATSLGACALTVMGLSAQNHGLDMTGARAEVTKIMSAQPPRRVAGITVRIIMPPTGFDAKQRDILSRAAHSCPVFLSLHPDIAVEMEIFWEG